MSKNIEKIKGEEALSEIVDITLDDAKLNGLVSNDIADMYQSASGLRPLKPTDTYESPIVELKANLKLIFRRLFSVPLTILGSNKVASPISIIKMMEQMFNHYRERLKGSEEYGIPSRLSQLTDLPDAPALLTDRDMSSGIRFGTNPIPDGMSLAQLRCSASSASSVTEIVDTNVGWTYNNNFPWSSFPNIKRVVLNCIDHTEEIISAPLEQVELPKLRHSLNKYIIINGALSEEITIPELEDFNGWLDYGSRGKGKVYNCPNLKVLHFPKLHTSATGTQHGAQSNIVGSCPNLEELYMPSFSYIFNAYIVDNCPKLRKVVFGTLKSDFTNAYGDYNNNFTNGSSTNLIHFEIGAGTGTGKGVILHMNWWIPTNALDASRTDLIEEGSTATNNLQQFLLNFRDVLFTRLAKRTSTTSLTLTLSPEVYKAVYGLDSDYNVDPNALAQTASLADFGITIEDLNEIEMAAGITTATKYATWLDTYRGAIYWNVQHS